MGEEVWRRHPKSQKQLKCKGVVPDLRVYKGLLVVIREGVWYEKVRFGAV